MIVYYDLFMVDDESLLTVRQSERFKRLKDLITVVSGRSALVRREIIDCDRRTAASDLRRAFAKCIVARGEGLVLKPDDPYFDFDIRRPPYSCCAIKLKKEYVGNFGDIGDFAVVGARYEAAKARAHGIPNLKWTHFYVGCLENKEDVTRFKRPPRFVVTNVVELNSTQLRMLVTHVNPQSVKWEENASISIRIEPGIDGGKRPSIGFVEPPVFDIRCFSFDKEGNTGFWSPRFAMVNKIHCDRTYRDALSFAELQDIAAKEKEQPPPEDSQELLGWIAALEGADPRSAAAEATSQSTVLSTEAPTSSSRSSMIEVTATWRPPTDGPIPGARIRSPPSSPDAICGVPTIPYSEAVSGGTASRGHQRVAEGRKRSVDDPSQYSPGRNKVRRCSKEQPKDNASCPSLKACLTTSQRGPLTDVRESSSRRNYDEYFRPRLVGVNSMYQPNLEDKDTGELSTVPISLPSSVSFREISTTRPSPRVSATQPAIESSTGKSGRLIPSSGKPAETPMGGCCFLPGLCTISNISFLLSPCISGFLWVTEDLIASHGVEFVRDPKEWRVASTTMTGTAPSLVHSAKTRRKKKVILVDTRRRKATTAFLNLVREAGLKRRNGETDWVPVFDWRVLEDLRDEETRCGRGGERPGSRFAMSGQKSIWKKHWVGLA